MPDLSNTIVNRIFQDLYKLQPGLGVPVSTTQLTEAQKKHLNAEQLNRQAIQQQFQTAAKNNTMILNYTQQQRQNTQEEDKEKNQLMNIANVVNLLVMQSDDDYTLDKMMQEAEQYMMDAQGNEGEPKHKAKGQEKSIGGSNNDDGNESDEESADVDSDGFVTDEERENFENFLVTKLEKTDIKFNVGEFRAAQEAGEPMPGAEAGAKNISPQVDQVVQDSVTAAAKNTNSNFNPLNMKPSQSPFQT